jgi:hypothetical protein
VIVFTNSVAGKYNYFYGADEKSINEEWDLIEFSEKSLNFL